MVAARLFVTEPDASGDPLGASRVTLIGTVTDSAFYSEARFGRKLLSSQRPQSRPRRTPALRVSGPPSAESALPSASAGVSDPPILASTTGKPISVAAPE